MPGPLNHWGNSPHSLWNRGLGWAPEPVWIDEVMYLLLLLGN